MYMGQTLRQGLSPHVHAEPRAHLIPWILDWCPLRAVLALCLEPVSMHDSKREAQYSALGETAGQIMTGRAWARGEQHTGEGSRACRQVHWEIRRHSQR